MAAGAKIWLQDIHNSLSNCFFALLLQFKFSLKFTVFWSSFYLGFVCLQPNFIFLSPACEERGVLGRVEACSAGVGCGGVGELVALHGPGADEGAPEGDWGVDQYSSFQWIV